MKLYEILLSFWFGICYVIWHIPNNYKDMLPLTFLYYLFMTITAIIGFVAIILFELSQDGYIRKVLNIEIKYT